MKLAVLPDQELTSQGESGRVSRFYNRRPRLTGPCQEGEKRPDAAGVSKDASFDTLSPLVAGQPL
jgi:hypothetical protein